MFLIAVNKLVESYSTVSGYGKNVKKILDLLKTTLLYFANSFGLE